MKHYLFLFFTLVCVGDFEKICFDPTKVVAIYQDKESFATNTIIALNDGEKLKTDITVGRIAKAIESVPN